MDNEFAANECGFMGQSDDYFTPATKEQRDLLFQKMKEGGYEWDAEKKELKKIEKQKPIECSLEQAAEIFLDSLAKTPYNNKPVTDAQIITKQLLNFLQNSVSYNPDALIADEQKPAEWSEEDEEMLQALVSGVGCYTIFSGIPSEDIVNWLKSLKQRCKEE